MKKAKKNFNTNKATYMANKLDFTNKGFVVDHAEKIIYTLEGTDAAIRKGDEAALDKAFALFNEYPNYSWGVLRVMFLA